MTGKSGYANCKNGRYSCKLLGIALLTLSTSTLTIGGAREPVLASEYSACAGARIVRTAVRATDGISFDASARGTFAVYETCSTGNGIVHTPQLQVNNQRWTDVHLQHSLPVTAHGV